MDPVQKKRWLDNILYNQIVPSNPDVDLTAITRFFETSEAARFIDHRSRYIETYIRLCRHVRLVKSWHIRETGHLSGLSRFLASQGYNVAGLKGDFRYAIECDSDSVDFMISLEVMEHIKDQDPATFNDVVLFNFSGVDTFVREIWRCVRPGGLVMLSTPNACSMISLERLLHYRAPIMFWPHVREYPPSEVIGRFEKCGFRTVHWETMFALFHLEAQVRSRRLKQYFSGCGASPENRGDIGFYLFQKPVQSDSPEPGDLA